MNKSLPSFHSNHISSYFLILVVLCFTLFSCKTAKESYYFKSLKKDTTIYGFVNNDFESKIKEGDNLSIIATSLSKEEDIIFNQAAGEISINGLNTSSPGFLVRKDGTITFHRLGDVKAAGMTRRELALYVQKALVPYMKDPVVNVNYLNHKVTVMGAVAKPQVINLPSEQISLIDALVLSGDATDESKRNDIMIIRQENNTKKVKHVNLEDHSIFTSSWYYIQPDDIVYVVPDSERRQKEEKRNALRTTLSLVASGASLLIILLDRIIK